jgi:hypothetical protein
LARKYTLSGSRSVPTTESATWWLIPAAVSAVRMLRDEVRKKSHHGCVVPGRRVRHVDDDLGPIEGFGQSLAGQDVDARVGRRRERVVAGLPQVLDELGSDEAGSADDDDLHRTASLRDHVFASTAYMMTETTVSGRVIRLRCSVRVLVGMLREAD